MSKPNLSLFDTIDMADKMNKIDTSNTLPHPIDIDIKNDSDIKNKDDLSQHPVDALEGTVLRLSDYLQATQMVIKETFSHHVWIKAEIRNLSSKGGHYYFELAEKEDTGKIIASCRGTLWRYNASPLLAKFERKTGMALSRDLTVLLQVNANFHPQYGFSVTIHDIDPNYTLGELAHQYTVMLERLAEEGLLTQNQQLPTPFDIEYVLVIAPEKAAGLGDFQADANRLATTGACHFDYHHATFQGNHAPTEIRQAIHNGMAQFQHTHKRLPDLMVIIRGGGAVGDLAYLNDFELASLVAEQPIPVWVGIGHERDRVLLDEVAHTSFDTPSKVIAAINTHLTTLMQRTVVLAQHIEQLSRTQIRQSQLAYQQAFQHIKTQSHYDLKNWQKDTQHAMNQITQQARYVQHQATQQTSSLFNQLHHNAYQHLTTATQAVKQSYQATQIHSQQLISNTQHQLTHYQQLILLQHPARLLQQGYAIIKDPQTQKIIHKSASLDKTQPIVIEMQDGQIMATVNTVQLKPVLDMPMLDTSTHQSP